MRRPFHSVKLILIALWSLNCVAAEEVFTLSELPNHSRALAQEVTHQLGNAAFRNLLFDKFSKQQKEANVVAAAAGESSSGVGELSIPLTLLLKEYKDELEKISSTSTEKRHALSETMALSQYSEKTDHDILEAKGIQGLASDLLELRLILPEVKGTEPAASTQNLFARPDNWQNLLVAYLPSGNDVGRCMSTKENPTPSRGSCKKGDPNFQPGWTSIEAFKYEEAGVQSRELNAKVQPDFPVIVVGINERKDMEAGLTLLNNKLVEARSQFQAVGGEKLIQASASTVPDCLDVHRLKNIWLEEDEEPWIKGAAEVYAIVNGLCTDKERKVFSCDEKLENVYAHPTVRPLPPPNEAMPPNMIPLEFVKYAQTPYDGKDQPLIFWDMYDWSEASMLFYEHDSGANYKEIALALINGVEKAFIAKPVAWAMAQIAGKVIEAMPTSWFTDDDDHLDTFPVIKDDVWYPSYRGTNNNVKVTLGPGQIRPRSWQRCSKKK